MPISGTSTNYSGRTRDINISYGLKPTSAGKQPVTYTFGKTSSYIAGVQKLVQRYTILLLNTGLVNQLQSARNSSTQEAIHIFNFLNWDVIKLLRDYQNSNTGLPEDEQLAGAQLIELTTSGDQLNIRIEITTKAGEDVVYLMPIPLQ